jgi:ribonucleoside-diphosphate reductase beta chain
LNDWNNKLSDEERYFVKHIAFAASDGLNENLAENFVNEVQYAEAKFLWFQIMMENIHSETYSLLIDTYVKTKLRKMEFNALEVFLLLRKKKTGL